MLFRSTLVLPTFTTSRPGPEFTGAQLTFAAIASAALYGMFVFTQTVRHRDFFLPVATGDVSGRGTHPAASDPPAGASVHRGTYVNVFLRRGR